MFIDIYQNIIDLRLEKKRKFKFVPHKILGYGFKWSFDICKTFFEGRRPPRR